MPSSNTNEYLKIHTGAYTDKAYDILKRFWTYKYHTMPPSGHLKKRSNYGLAHVDINPSKEVTWNICRSSSYFPAGVLEARGYFNFHNSSYAMHLNCNQTRIRAWLAAELKSLIIELLQDDSCIPLDIANKIWKNSDTSDQVIKEFSGKFSNMFDKDLVDNLAGDITVAQVRCLYYKILDRKSLNKVFSKDVITLVIGEENDPIKTEAENIKRTELAALKNKLKYNVSKTKNECRLIIDEFAKKTTEKYNHIENDLLVEYNKIREQIIKSFDEIYGI